ncbi:MAG: ABC transporter permease [Bacteroidetes bacterium]|nr:ABC transporter permease [Bacteroidota bacterium]
MSRIQKEKQPPKVAEYLLRKILPDNTWETPLGDFAEYYNMLLLQKGRMKAGFWYWGQLLNLIPRKILNSLLWGFVMFNNYLKIAFRNLLKYKGFSFINIVGLALGMACSLLIILYVQFETSYDSFHENADDIYRIDWITDSPQTRTPYPMARALVRDLPEVIDAVTISPMWGPGLTRPTFSVRYEDKLFDETGFYQADTSFFNMFSFKLLQGNKQTALQTFGGIVITERIAHKYFGNENPIGKRMMLNENPDLSLEVTGVMENIPDNSHFHFDFLISYVTLIRVSSPESEYYTWNDFGHYNYIKLKPGTDPKVVEAKIPDWSRQYINWSESTFEALKKGTISLRLKRLTGIHLYSNIKWELETNGDITYVYVFSSAAFLILLIACVNFTNLTIARAMKRSREIGVRKVIGAARKQLFWQFFGETFLSSIVALVVSTLFVIVLLPLFSQVIGREITPATLVDNNFLLKLVFIALVATIIAGGYPAMFLSGMNPVTILKGTKIEGSRIESFSKGLVVFQFVVSIVLIIGAGIVSSQLDFLSNKNIGFKKDHVLVIPIKSDEIRTRYFEVKNELKKHQFVQSASAISNIPGTNFNRNDIQWESEEHRLLVSEMFADEDFISTLGIELKEGRTFSREFSTDNEASFIVNETAARYFNWDTAIDKEIEWLGDMFQAKGNIIGVVKDFNFRSLHSTIEPLLIQVVPGAFNYMLVKINTDNLNEAISTLESEWLNFDQVHEFEFSFLDESMNKQYQAEMQMQTVFTYFTMVGIFIACMGLFGLSALNIQRKVKEIGIRKAMGASVTSVLKLIVSEYIRMIVVANIIAWPIAYYFMASWLNKFAYRTELNLLIFALAGLMVLLVTTLTVMFQAVKAALVNPVKCLKEE